MGRILGQLVHRRLGRVSVVNVFGQLFFSLLSPTFIRFYTSPASLPVVLGDFGCDVTCQAWVRG